MTEEGKAKQDKHRSTNEGVGTKAGTMPSTIKSRQLWPLLCPPPHFASRGGFVAFLGPVRGGRSVLSPLFSTGQLRMFEVELSQPPASCFIKL